MAQGQATLDCPYCGTSLPARYFGTEQLFHCPRCWQEEQAEVFPAFYRKPEPGQGGERLLADEEASCFYHPQKKAAVACEGCGRFLCGLCEVEFLGRRLCPACIQAGKNKKKIRNLETQRVLYDGVALSLAILPLLIWPFTILTAPAALLISIRYWNAPIGILSRTKIRFILAILFSSVQIFVWALVVYKIWFKR